ncbi:MAG TPA: 4-alpha-glucanotransferase [Thermoanaerobaculia bacterium]|nr:4-alpha-glucanotransferase [Thermoanaerobaculia bacterium]
MRTAGVLLHPTSLPGCYGIGDLGDELIAFLDWAASAGFKLWQVLPLNPPGFGNSPYGCLSSFAGNPMLVSPQRLLQENLLAADTVANVPHFSDDRVEFDRVLEWKTRVLHESWKHFNAHATSDQRSALAAFIENERAWLDDFTLFMTIKEHSKGHPWSRWSKRFARRDAKAITRARNEWRDGIHYHAYVQWLFFSQWSAAREAAHARGIRIVGDVPIYVADDSADVWANPELFFLDDHGNPTVIAGVPPDSFSETGQRWGNPLYRWDVLRETNFRWWIARVRANLRFADVIRLDHFRGFAAYWEIPASEPTAIHGRWMPGPGIALFEAMREALGELPLIAEDLGFITEDVHELRRATGLPGMKILQFGFGGNDSSHLPHHYEPKTVAYTGTHDNDTARGWFDTASEAERERARLFLGDGNIAWLLTRAAYTSVADTAVVPVQDILGLGGEARMNLPGEEKNNWSWRLHPSALTREHAERLRRLAEVTGR